MQKMNCEEWILSRTDNPEKYGLAVWQETYNTILLNKLSGRKDFIDNTLLQDYAEKCHINILKVSKDRRELLQSFFIDLGKNSIANSCHLVKRVAEKQLPQPFTGSGNSALKQNEL